ncbi:MAG TPA: hypothetical protein VMV48_04750 [Gallionellaceae bacterium]|nr:hypothetical protein [Gallionellaceae bacterium]
MKHFLEKLSNWTYLTLWKVFYWAQRSAFKKALDLKVLCARVLDAEVRILEPFLLQIGENDDDDALVEYVSRNLTQRQMIEGIENTAHLRSDLATQLLDRCKQSQSACEVIATYFLAEAFAASILKDEERKDSGLKDARQFVPNAQPLEVNNIYKIHAKLKKRFSVIRSALAERSSLKIDFQLSNLIGLIGVISALFVLSGFLYTSILLGSFGIDVSLFFSLPDYLAASIEQIHHAAIPTVFGLVMFVFGLREGSMKSRLIYRLQREQRSREGKLLFILVIALSANVVWGLYNDMPNFSNMKLLGVIAAYWLAEQLAYMFFKRPLSVQVFLVALFTFIIYTGVSLFQQIQELKAGNWSNRDTLKISLKKPLSEKSDSLVVIAANNNFIFALSKINKLAYAIPRENVELIEMKWSK